MSVGGTGISCICTQTLEITLRLLWELFPLKYWAGSLDLVGVRVVAGLRALQPERPQDAQVHRLRLGRLRRVRRRVFEI